MKIEQEEKKSVQIRDKFSIIASKRNLSQDQIKSMMHHWYRDQAGKIFATRLRHCIKIVEDLEVRNVPQWTVRVMVKRWGSCTKTGRILLHPELVAAPVSCIDYVIVHELCHLIEHSHNSRYYELLSSVMPDWAERKSLLNETVEVRLM